MSAAKITSGIYNIPAGTSFARSLAAQLIQESGSHPEALAAYRIILPTRRAVRVLREAFLDETEGKPLLLPQMHALGDIDEEELSLSLLADETPTGLLDIPPALPPLKRQILLAKTIQKIPDYAKGFDQALLLAAALGRLMDHVYTEGLDLQKLPSLVSAERLAAHWQVTLTFMEILSVRWPDILAAEGAIDGADRRGRLLRALAKRWEKSPPRTPIIAAGTTGTIPATAELLRVIATLPQGRVVLPGLDPDIDPEGWDLLTESHPQHAIKHLLDKLGIDRSKVLPWPNSDAAKQIDQSWLAGEIMRPAETTESWANDLPDNKQAQQKINNALKNINILTCANEREEAAAIALLLRQALETPGRTAALITPRRGLARRVAAACRRWNIALDDSAGRPLSETPAGSYVRLSADAAAADFSPVALLALLKHPFCRADGIQNLDLALRGPKPIPGIPGLKERADNKIMRIIEPVLTRFMGGSSPEKPRQFSKIVKSHIEMLEALALNPETPWQGEDGEKAAAFFASLLDHAEDFPNMNLPAYANVISALIKDIVVRPAYGAHPRLRILGQLEARMTDADLVIMAGLNEKTWPPEASHDPWMSRPMRDEFGLPPPERQIGLAAHDFVQGFCAPHVVLTRSLRQDGGPTVPARWLQRLDAILDAAAISPDAITASPVIGWANAMDETDTVTPVRRPEPRPPVSARPRALSVTRIEKWRQDPYGIYAEYVLRLRKTDPLEKDIDAAERGELLHETMKNFAGKTRESFPENAAAILIETAEEEIARRREDISVWSFWRRRFEKAAHALAQHEQDWRQRAQPTGIEIRGEIPVAAKGGDFLLSARADRIDRLAPGGAIIDYKSGGQFNPGDITGGKMPQLPLEGFILAKGGFKEIGRLEPVSLQYWTVTGGAPPVKITRAEQGLKDVIDDAESGLRALISAFDSESTPYYSVPRPGNAPRFSDYGHLARIAEWAALGDDDSEAAA
ncbi:MAG: double-strand break repair protein AddB [Alphaproteobacteria bacterium PRO2]|nr:double-strand break repair protein AddB [Alphaproteobacteria bacterium PRO2]